MKTGNILIRDGTVVDPARGVHGGQDVLIRGNTFVEVLPGEAVEAEHVVDASGCLVLPGLIDHHTHCFYGGSEAGVVPDASFLPMGVTTTVDQGSSGFVNCDSFMQMVAQQSQMRIFCSVNVAPPGLITDCYTENLDPRYYSLGALRDLLDRYGSRIVGLKVRQGVEMVGDLGLAPLKATIAMATELNCRVTVHPSNPPCDMDELVSLLRAGDILCHCFHGLGSSIIDGNGKVSHEVRQARERGVIFDTADGRIHHSFAVIKAALADGFYPDVISTDVTRFSLFGSMVFGLPMVMSKFLSLGLGLEHVVRACTATPAELIGMGGKLGTLAPGALADVAVFQLVEKPFRITNRLEESFDANQLLVPKMTVLNGKVMFRQIDFGWG